MFEPPQVLYRLDDILKDSKRTVRIGVLVSPDVTLPWNHVPAEFDKEIEFVRDFEIRGRNSINDEELRTTSAYSYGFDPLVEVCRDRKKIGGRAQVSIRVIDRPIFLMPEEEEERGREVHYLDSFGWFDISTDAGRDFFERWAAATNGLDRHLARYAANEDIREEANLHRIQCRQTDYALYDSYLTVEENMANMTRILTSLDIKFSEDDLRSIIDG